MWEVRLSKRALKQTRKLPPEVRQSLATLMKGLQIQGPVAGNWANYGKLSPNCHHCHIKKGKPTYVAVWEVRDQKIHVIEVIYVGTHEKAPY